MLTIRIMFSAFPFDFFSFFSTRNITLIPKEVRRDKVNKISEKDQKKECKHKIFGNDLHKICMLFEKNYTILRGKKKMRFEDKWIHLSIIHQVSG